MLPILPDTFGIEVYSDPGFAQKPAIYPSIWPPDAATTNTRQTVGSHPHNLAMRFLLELVALVALGRWGWLQSEGPLRFVLALTIPLLAALLWGTLAVPDDPSRSGRVPLPIPGTLRLLLELLFFTLATAALFAIGAATFGWILGTGVLIHYALSYDRIRWLVKQKP